MTNPYGSDTVWLSRLHLHELHRLLPKMSLYMAGQVYGLDRQFLKYIDHVFSYFYQFFFYLNASAIPKSCIQNIFETLLKPLMIQTNESDWGFLECISLQNILPISPVLLKALKKYFDKSKKNTFIKDLFSHFLCNCLLLGKIYVPEKKKWMANKFYHLCSPYAFHIMNRENNASMHYDY
jgi:hypothetical protein